MTIAKFQRYVTKRNRNKRVPVITSSGGGTSYSVSSSSSSGGAYASLIKTNTFNYPQIFNGSITAGSVISNNSISGSTLLADTLQLGTDTTNTIVNYNDNIKVKKSLYVDGDLHTQGTIYAYSQDEINIGDSWLNLGVADATAQDGGIRIKNEAGTEISKLWYGVSDNFWRVLGNFYAQGGTLEAGVNIQCQGNWNTINKNLDGWITWATRNSAGNESVIDLSNIGTITTNNSINVFTAAGNTHLGHVGTSNYLSFHTSGKHIWRTWNGSAYNEVAHIDGSGNINIGSPTVHKKLNIAYGGDATGVSVQRTDNGANNILGYNYVGTFSNHNLHFYANSINAMTINTNGNVGIGAGATSPLIRLFVRDSEDGNVVGYIQNTHATNGYGLAVYGGNSVSNYCQTWRNYAGTSLATIKGDGTFIVGSETKITSIQKMQVDGGLLIANSNQSAHSWMNLQGSNYFTQDLTQDVNAKTYFRIYDGSYVNHTQVTSGGNWLYNGKLGTSNFFSQTTGWQIDELGQADFRYIFTDELRAKAFTADVSQALAGSDFLTKSVSKLSAKFTIPATNNSGSLIVDDLEGIEGIACFSDGDWIRLRVFDRSGGGLIIADVWGTVVLSTLNSNNTQTYTFTCKDDGGVAGGFVYKGAMVLDYGTSGSGIIERTVLDQQGGNYSQITTWHTDPSVKANHTVKLRMGDLAGINDSAVGLTGSQGHIYGLYADSVYLKGTIVASSGNIAGHSITSTRLQKVHNNCTIDLGLESIWDTYYGLNIKKDASNFIRMATDGNNNWLDARKDGNFIFSLQTVGDSKIADWNFDANTLSKSSGANELRMHSNPSLVHGTTHSGTSPTIMVWNSTHHNMVSIGNIYKNKDNDGIAIHSNYSTNTKIFEVSKNKNTGALTAQIAGWGFDNTKFYNSNIEIDNANSNINFNENGNIKFYTSLGGTLTGNIYTTGGNLILEPQTMSTNYSTGWIDIKGSLRVGGSLQHTVASSTYTLSSSIFNIPRPDGNLIKVTTSQARTATGFYIQTTGHGLGESFIIQNTSSYAITLSCAAYGSSAAGQFVSAYGAANKVIYSKGMARITSDYQFRWFVEIL